MDNKKENHRFQLTTLNNSYMLPINYIQVTTGCSQHREQSSMLRMWQTQLVCLSVGLSSSGPSVLLGTLTAPASPVQLGASCQDPARLAVVQTRSCRPLLPHCSHMGSKHRLGGDICWRWNPAQDIKFPLHTEQKGQGKEHNLIFWNKGGRRAKYIKSIILDLKCKWYIPLRQK